MKNMDSNVAVDDTAYLTHSRLIKSDNMEQILNMNKRMKVRRKLRRQPSSSTSSSSSLNWFVTRTRITSSATTTTKTMFISLLTLCHVLGFTLCIGESVCFLTFPFILHVVSMYECFLFNAAVTIGWVHACLARVLIHLFKKEYNNSNSDDDGDSSCINTNTLTRSPCAHTHKRYNGFGCDFVTPFIFFFVRILHSFTLPLAVGVSCFCFQQFA